MPHYLRTDRARPLRIEPADAPMWLCACGLSRAFPKCDGSHKRLAADLAHPAPAAPPTLPAYDDAGTPLGRLPDLAHERSAPTPPIAP